MDNKPNNGSPLNSAETIFVPKTSKSKTPYFIILVGIIALVGVAYYFYEPTTPEVIPNAQDEMVVATPSGTIILTATLDGLPAVYTLDLETENSSFLKYPSGYTVTAFPEFTDKINSEKVFFVASTQAGAEEVDKLGISSWTLGGDEVGVQTYSSSAGNIERDLNWSEEAKRLAFYRAKASAEIPTEGSLTIDNYEIVVMDPAQDVITAVIDGGVHPRWSTTGESLLYLKKDGLYEFIISSKTETKIKGPNQSEGVINPAEMLDVSPDKSKLIITSQGPGLVSMFDIISWNPLVIELDHTFKDVRVHYSNPQFSPDGMKYALLTFDMVGQELHEPRLEIRESRSAEVVHERPVDAFDMTQFYISDWIAEPIVAQGEVGA